VPLASQPASEIGQHNAITAGTGIDNIFFAGTGSNTVSHDLTGSVSIFAAGSVEITGTFNGSATIGNGSKLTLDAASTGSGAIVFQAGGIEELIINGTSLPTNVVTGFEPGDIIDLANIPYDAAGGVSLFDSSADQLDIFEGGTNYQLNFSPGVLIFSTNDFSLTSDGNGGTDVTFATNWNNKTPSLKGTWSESRGQPSLQNLADLAADSYKFAPLGEMDFLRRTIFCKCPLGRLRGREPHYTLQTKIFLTMKIIYSRTSMTMTLKL
jgi:hypothetical protein